MLFSQHFVDVCRHFEIDAQSVEMRPTAIDFSGFSFMLLIPGNCLQNFQLKRFVIQFIMDDGGDDLP